MKKFSKNLFKIFGILIGVIAIYLLFMTLTDYRPKDIISLKIENDNKEIVQKDLEISILSFNIGYCGMDKGRDFFMDGGKGSRSISEEKTLDNLFSITEFIKKANTSIVFLQEVDIDSTRSFHFDEYAYLTENLSDYSSTFALNFKVPWIPVPIHNPHGSVKSGLATYSTYKIEEANRYQYPGEYGWPKQLAMLDRCFVESRIKVDNDRELVLVNSHLSVFDDGGEIRKQQLEFLKNYITKEYEKGNYVVVGGDWNHVIQGTDPYVFKCKQKWPEWLMKIPEDFTPKGFIWASDAKVPSNRTVDIPYEKGVNFLSVIDGFLVSPNIEVKSVKGYDLGFEYSDHNPTIMEFILK
jgi:endonuclease/exonuclease/phosphatase family metal-dependent hydrolase